LIEVGATDSKSNLGPKWLLDIATITTCRGQAGFCKLMTKLANFMPVNLVGKEGERKYLSKLGGSDKSGWE